MVAVKGDILSRYRQFRAGFRPIPTGLCQLAQQRGWPVRLGPSYLGGVSQLLAVAERLDDGSRGLQPTDEGSNAPGVAERRLRSAAFTPASTPPLRRALKRLEGRAPLKTRVAE